MLLLANIGLQLVNPQIMRTFIDVATTTAASAETAKTLLRAALLFIGVALAQQIVSVAATYFGETVGWTSTNALRADLAKHCLHLDMSFHNARTPGEMIERIDGDMNALSNFFSQFVIQVFGNALLLIGVLVLLYREDWRVGLAFSVFVALALAAMLAPAQHRRAPLEGRAPGQRRAVWLSGGAAGRHRGHPLQRGQALRHAPLYRADARPDAEVAQGRA